MEAKIEAITKESFTKSGQVIEVPVKDEPTVAVPTVTFWTQQAMLSIDGDTEVGVLIVKEMDMVFDELENHFNLLKTDVKKAINCHFQVLNTEKF